jgi:enoyl-CoA hydratase
MKFETIVYEKEGPIAWISLNRPEKLNAMTQLMVDELLLATDKAQCDDDIRVMILKGKGRAFSAGFDLEIVTDPDRTKEEELQELKNELHNDFELIMRFWDSPKPTIAAVHTYCLGGALELAIACDITIAATGCRFGEPEVKFGSGAVAMLLPFVCGPKRAKEILLTGSDQISAEQAESWGLVNRVVKPENLILRAREVGMEIARNDQLAVRITKQAINSTYEFGKMRNALKHALELNIAIESTETEESRQFNEILRNEGTRAALDWRDRRLGYTGQVKRHDTA